MIFWYTFQEEDFYTYETRSIHPNIFDMYNYSFLSKPLHTLGSIALFLSIVPLVVLQVSASISEVTAIPSLSNNPTPSYTFSSTATGATSYG